MMSEYFIIERKKMKKIIQAGLLVSGLASSLVASQATDLIRHGEVKVSQKGDIELNFISPYENPIINIESLHDNIKGNFSISLVDAEQDKYKITLKHKGNVQSCNNKIMLEDETLRLHISPNESSTQFADATIIYKPCYEDGNTNKYHFETAHPYKNNTNITKTLPPLCPSGRMCPQVIQYAYIKGETEKNYDFITISQDGKELGKFSGKIDKSIPISSNLPTDVTFTSDYSITKSGITVDLH